MIPQIVFAAIVAAVTASAIPIRQLNAHSLGQFYPFSVNSDGDVEVSAEAFGNDGYVMFLNTKKGRVFNYVGKANNAEYTGLEEDDTDADGTTTEVQELYKENEGKKSEDDVNFLTFDIADHFQTLRGKEFVDIKKTVYVFKPVAYYDEETD